MKQPHSTSIMQGAFVLSAAAFIAKVLSAIYRVPFQNLVGNTGFYVYQQIYPIYGIGMTFALSGLPVFISKLVAESPTVRSQRQVMHKVFWLLVWFSLIIFSGLTVGAPAMAQAMGDGHLTPLIRSVAWMFLLMPPLSVSRGFYQGQFNMLPTASSQLIEQTVRVTVILFAAGVAVHLGWSDYRMGTWAMASGAVAALAALWTLRGIWREWRLPAEGTWRYEPLARRLLIEGGTICLLTAMIVLLQLVDSFSVKNGLVAGGHSSNMAKALKGIYDRAQPLVQLGLVAATAFSASLLPSLTAARKRQSSLEFFRVSGTMMRVGFALATATTMGLIALMPMINTLLFGNQQGNHVLEVYVLSVIFATLIQTFNAVLQSLDRYRLTIIALGAGLSVKVVLNWWAVKMMGTIGASWVTVLSLAVIFMVVWLGSPVELRRRIWSSSYFSRLAAVTLVMGGAVGVVVQLLMLGLPGLLLHPRLFVFVALIVAVPVGVLVFGLLTLRWRVLTIRDWLMIPNGPRVLRFFKRFK